MSRKPLSSAHPQVASRTMRLIDDTGSGNATASSTDTLAGGGPAVSPIAERLAAPPSARALMERLCEWARITRREDRTRLHLQGPQPS
jgi:hypothetical protein